MANKQSVWVGETASKKKQVEDNGETASVIRDEISSILDSLLFGPWELTAKPIFGKYIFSCEFTNHTGFVGSIQINDSSLVIILNSMTFKTTFKTKDLMLDFVLGMIATQLPLMVNQTMEMTVALAKRFKA